MRVLLAAGSSTAAADARGATPLHLSAAHDDAEGLRMLRAHRADLWAADREGHRPLDVARRQHRPSRFVRSLLLMPERLPNGEEGGGGGWYPTPEAGGDEGGGGGGGGGETA